MMKLIFSLLLAGGVLLGQTTTNGGVTVLGPVDLSGATTTKPVKTGTSDPAACSVGEQFYRTDTATLKHCSATNTWTAVGGSYTLPTASTSVLGGIKIGTGLSIDGSGVVTASGGGYDTGDSSVMVMRDDFFSGSQSTSSPLAGALNWYTSLTGSATTSGAVGDQNHPGVYTATSHATNADSGAMWNMQAPSYGYMHADTVNNADWEVTFIAKLGSTSNARVWLGLDATGAFYTARFLGFRYDTSASYTDDTKNTTGAWVAQMCASTCADATGTRIIMAQTPDTNWHRFTVSKSGTTYTWKIDGTTKATACPSGCDATATTQTSGLGVAARLAFESGGSVTHSLDFAYFRISGLTR